MRIGLNMNTLITTLSTIIIVTLSGCAFPLDKNAEKAAFSPVSATLKIDKPKYQQITVKGLESLFCDEKICTMSVTDFQQNQSDKKKLFALHKLAHEKDLIRVETHNALVDSLMAMETAQHYTESRAENLEKALRQEQTKSAIEKWVERVLFIGGAYLFSTF